MEVNDVLTYSYTGAVQTVTLEAGIYKLECWGAAGGASADGLYGLGGYATGEIEILANTILYINVGGKGGDHGVGSAGWNGGGQSTPGGAYGGGGGGASDIRIGGTAFFDRVIVGAGAGGGGKSIRIGGYGGGLVGGDYGTYGGSGGTQSTGSAFGIGGNSSTGGGGGGGWYGGYNLSTSYSAGGGGSSYIGGTVATQGYDYPRIPLSNASTTSGLRSGDGEVKITMLTKLSGTKRIILAAFV